MYKKMSSTQTWELVKVFLHCAQISSMSLMAGEGQEVFFSLSSLGWEYDDILFWRQDKDLSEENL